LVAALIGTPALAADMPVKAPPLPPAPVFSWTGFYAGGELGAKWMASTWTTTSLFNFAPNPFIDASSPRSFDPSSARIGAYVGYNWQFAAQWIAGIEADVAYANNTVSSLGIPGCTILCTAPFVGGPILGPDASSVRVGWDASARARLGVLVMPNLLFYGTGGAAWQNIETSATCQHSHPDPKCGSIAGSPISTDTNSFTRLGWTLGGGAEWHVAGGWIARAEYRYAQFGTPSGLLNLSLLANTSTVGYQLKTSTSIATLGLAYHFGGGGML
jgi:outer membrane immunogenic protein